MDPVIREAITLAVALLGAVLGIINLWRSWHRDRVRLIVIPGPYKNGALEFGLRVEVVNVGFFPVTINSVGYKIHGEGDGFPTAVRIVGRDGLPERLEPRASLTAIIPTIPNEYQRLARMRCVVARTACGKRFTGNNKFLRHYREACLATKKRAP